MQFALKCVSFSDGSVYSEQLDNWSWTEGLVLLQLETKGVTAGWRRLLLPEGVVVVGAYFGSGGPSASGFMESLQSERKTRKASFCRMWEKRAALWGPCRASASCHAGSALLADSGRCARVGPRDVLRGHVPTALPACLWRRRRSDPR